MRRIRLFPGMIFGLLGLNVCIVGVTVYAAHSDPSFAVEANYYQRALAWDQTAAQQRQNAALGWHAPVEVGAGGPLGRRVSVRLTGPAGEPLGGAAIDLIAFHNARASQQIGATLPEAGGGLYQDLLPLEREGEWEFRLTIRRGRDTFTASASLTVRNGP